ncbi:hypothetical protein HHI36_014589 [Cryptolaemus montrouzieri]|uniref:Uncharacterized protein n=1 Tax=Cryptolaemus montrouzieri TaxID=559131 RepID=A0ABD2N314_9CUCU
MFMKILFLNRELKDLSKEQLTDKCYRDYIAETEMSIKSDPKHFWSFVNQRNSVGSFPSCMFLIGRLGHGGSEIVNLFADHFSSSFNFHIPTHLLLTVTYAWI